MSHRITKQFLTGATDAAFAALDVSSLSEKTIQVGGTFTGTLSVEGVLDDLLLDEYVALPNLSGLTAAAMAIVLEGVKKIRVNITAHSAGTPIVIISGRLIR